MEPEIKIERNRLEAVVNMASAEIELIKQGSKQ